jgi:predicted amidohydrolase YtcJ
MCRLLALSTTSLLLLTGPAMGQSDLAPDIILHHTQVLTLAETPTSAEAVAIQNGRILALGRNSEILALRGPKTEIRSLRDKAVIPGFLSGPTNLTLGFARSLMADCGPPPNGRVKSSVDVITELARKQAELGSETGEWVVGFGYRMSEDPAEMPLNARNLDLGFPDSPVYVLLTSDQGAVCNSKALALLGITEETPDPPLGRIGRRTESSDQWGVLWGTAWNQASRRVPRATVSDFISQLVVLQRQCLAAGITSVWGGVVDYATYQSLVQADRDSQLILDFIVYLELEDGDNLADLRTAFGSAEPPRRLQLAGVSFATETFETVLPQEPRKAALGRLKQTSIRKTLPISDGEAERRLKLVTELDQPVLLDSQSAEGLAVLFRSLSRLEQRHLPKPSLLRTQLPLVAKDLELLSNYSILPAYATDECLFDPRLSQVQLDEEESSLGPLHQLALSRDIQPLLFTRQSISPRTPMTLWHSAVNRMAPDGRVINPGQRISVGQALRAMTLLPAQFSKREDRVGQLLPGLQADFVILDRNPYSIVPTRINRIQVLETFKAGRRLHPE